MWTEPVRWSDPSDRWRMTRLEAVAFALVFMFCAWVGAENMMAAKIHEDVRATLDKIEARKVDPAVAYYGERSERLPCCPVLYRWR